MKILKKILCFLLCVVILSGTVGTKYLDSNHMETVEAAGTVVVVGGITLATMFEICLFVGATALAVYGIGEAYQNREEIARFGKEFIDSCSDKAEGWVMQFVDASGQDYVFGSEALELVRSTEWSVIQGGMPPEGDPNKKDDKDKNKFHIPGDPLTHVAQFTALGATWFTTNAKQIYQDWCNVLNGWVGKDTPIPQNNVLFNNFPFTLTEADILEQQKGGYNAEFSLYSQNRCDACAKVVPVAYSGSFVSDNIPAIYVTITSNRYNPVAYSFQVFDGSKSIIGNSCSVINYSCGHQKPSGNLTCSGNPFMSNIPVFDNLDILYEYVRTGHGYENALNYGKDYRIADWLQQDWAGQFIDPLVNIGLTLSQLIEIMKQLGLKTMQGLTAEQLLELLKKVLPQIDPALLPGASPAPAVDPAVDPIYYPDPDAHPDKPPRPVIDPDPVKDPGMDPDPGTDPDPDPGEAPLPDMDAADYKVELTGIFPFCIPFDFIALLKTLDAEPRAPCFTFPVVIPALDYREDVKLDLAIFDDVAKVIRLCEKVSFILFLMFVTSKVIRW